MVKNRESYRPFAPSVLEEYADQFFEVPDGSSPAYMTFTVPVREAMRPKLPAITHIDGTARIQTVSRNTNERYWRLIEAFRQRTGVPVVLNTSFNHNLEPIVDSVEDAITCLLTTGLTHLVIDNYLITKRPVKPAIVSQLFPTLPEHVQLVYCQQAGSGKGLKHLYRLESTVGRNTSRPISAATPGARCSPPSRVGRAPIIAPSLSQTRWKKLRRSRAPARARCCSASAFIKAAFFISRS